MSGWHIEFYNSGTLKLDSHSENMDKDTAFRYAKQSKGMIRVVERRPGLWVYYYRSGRKAGEWACPSQ